MYSTCCTFEKISRIFGETDIPIIGGRPTGTWVGSVITIVEKFLVRSSAEDIRGKIVVITNNKLIKRYQPGDFKSIFRVLRG